MVKRKNPNRPITAAVIRGVARAMLPFYTEITRNPKYAGRWSKAVIQADLSRMQTMLRPFSTSAAKNLGTNAIGYFVSFPWRNGMYVNGTAIPTGTVQFRFETRVHRSIARSILPFYRKMATCRSFDLALAKAIRRGDTKCVNRMVRQFVKTPALKSVKIESSGFALLFRYPFSKYRYRHLLTYEIK